MYKSLAILCVLTAMSLVPLFYFRSARENTDPQIS